MSLQYLIDTDTFIYIKNHRPPQVLERFRNLDADSASISVITYGELFSGCEKSGYKEKNHNRLKQLIEIMPVQTLPNKAGAIYGRLRAVLEKQGNIIGANDMWIAAHALSLGLTLVTNNTTEFERIEGLKVENWVEE